MEKNVVDAFSPVPTAPTVTFDAVQCKSGSMVIRSGKREFPCLTLPMPAVSCLDVQVRSPLPVAELSRPSKVDMLRTSHPMAGHAPCA